MKFFWTIIFFSTFYSLSWGASQNYNEANAVIENLSKKYDRKITHQPPADFSNHFTIQGAALHGDQLLADRVSISKAENDLAEEYGIIYRSLEAAKANEFINQNEFIALQGKLKKNVDTLQEKYAMERKKYVELNARLRKKYSPSEFIAYLKTLDLGSSCKLKVEKVGEDYKVTLTKVVGGNIKTLDGVLHFDEKKYGSTMTTYGDTGDYGYISTVYSDAISTEYNEQTKIRVTHKKDGSIQGFHFESLNKRPPPLEVPLFGLVIKKKAIDSSISCYDFEDNVVSEAPSVNNSKRESKEVSSDSYKINSSGTKAVGK